MGTMIAQRILPGLVVRGGAWRRSMKMLLSGLLIRLVNCFFKEEKGGARRRAKLTEDFDADVSV